MDDVPLDDAVLRDLDAAVDDLRDDRDAFLAELVRYPSTLGDEGPVQARMADAFAEAGFEVDAFSVDWDALRDLPGFSPVAWHDRDRPIVVGVHRAADPSGRSLILNGHVDVVPAGPEALWSRPPFEPKVVDGWMHGRGAGDMKAGVAAYLYAVRALARAGFEPASDLIVQSVIEEECSGNGALATAWRGYRADAAVIPEPFDHTLLVQQLGVAWLTVTVHGRPTHVLEAGAGADAIRVAWSLIEELRAFEAEQNRADALPPGYAEQTHPVNLNVGRIAGGEWTSSVPAACTFQVRIGIVPGDCVAALQRRVEDRIAAFCADHPVLRELPPRLAWVGFHAEPYGIAPDAPVMRALGDAHRAVIGDAPAQLHSTATTDARILAGAGGTPTTCYGPRARAIHGVDEAVDLASVHRTTKVLARTVASWCGLRRRTA
ncbi:MAG: ArgE/DapE family deacylase [Trueperaceae bacterium]